MQLIKLYDKYDRELFLDIHNAVKYVPIVDRQNTLMRRIILWLWEILGMLL